MLQENAVPLPFPISLIGSPSQTVVPSALAVGRGFTITATVAIVVALQSLLAVIVTVYVPVLVISALAIVGLCSVELNPGPDHK